MSDIADISDGLLKMEDELKSFHEVLKVVDEAMESTVDTIQASNSLNNTAQLLNGKVRDLVMDINKLDLDRKIKLLENLSTDLREDINSTSSQITSIGEKSQRGFDHLDNKLDEKIQIVRIGFHDFDNKLNEKTQILQTETHDGLIKLNGEIIGRIDAVESVVDRLKIELNSFYQKGILENENFKKSLLILTILGSLIVLLLVALLILNIR